MLLLDAHQHFWQFNPVRDAWISPDMSVLRRDFLPADLQPLLEKHHIAGCIAVQADQSEDETRFLLNQAAIHPVVAGVVGWVDLRSDRLPAILDGWAGLPKLKGFRHILQAEVPEFMLQTAFLRGIRTIAERGYSYDILVFPRHLTAVHKLLRTADKQAFVVDHLAKPYLRRGQWRQWAKDLRSIARFPNVHCKLSGMVTEANWQRWQPADFSPYLDIALEAFGAERLMYGSDWPVCLLAASYAQQFEALQVYVRKLSPTEQANIMGQTAARFYKV